MIIIRLEGGLGNIMFQYALGRHLAYKNKTNLKFDVSSYKTNPLGDYSFSLEAFNINIKKNLATVDEIRKFKKYQKRSGKIWFLYNHLLVDSSKYFQEQYYHFNPDTLKLKGSFYLHGWWQTEKYFRDIRDILLDDFTVQKPLLGKNKDVAEKIATTDSISIHVRRLDYVTNPKTKQYHGELTEDYYRKALARISLKIKNPTLFIFSDDIPWVKKNLLFPFQTIYIDWNKKSPHEDVRLMSLCKHNITANSSLGWWGAWLNRNPDKIVVAPKRWVATQKLNTKDVIPDTWITI